MLSWKLYVTEAVLFQLSCFTDITLPPQTDLTYKILSGTTIVSYGVLYVFICCTEAKPNANAPLSETLLSNPMDLNPKKNYVLDLTVLDILIWWRLHS